MIFRKKKRMIDLRELQKRGVVNLPKKDIVIPTDNQGFIELNSNSARFETFTPEEKSKTQGNANFFGFMDNSKPSNSSTETDGYNKREVDEKITNLDNKIYKLEQRVELLERKLNVNQSNNNLIGW